MHKGGSNFKSSVVKIDSHVRSFAIKEQKLDDRLTMVYSNRDQVTAALVKTNEIDFEECGKFFDHFFEAIDKQILGQRSDTESHDWKHVYKPFTEYSAEREYKQYQSQLSKLLTAWNNN